MKSLKLQAALIGTSRVGARLGCWCVFQHPYIPLKMPVRRDVFDMCEWRQKCRREVLGNWVQRVFCREECTENMLNMILKCSVDSCRQVLTRGRLTMTHNPIKYMAYLSLREYSCTHLYNQQTKRQQHANDLNRNYCLSLKCNRYNEQ